MTGLMKVNVILVMNDRRIQKERKQDTAEQKGVLEMVIKSFEVDAITREGYYPVSLQTSRGVVHCRYYAASKRDKSVIFIGNEGGGWDAPVKSTLYSRLSNQLSRRGFNCLRIEYRYPSLMAESILDVLAGITFLTQEGIKTTGLVGYGQGAAVAIQTAAASENISTVVAISPRAFGFNALSSFRKNQSILMLHGSLDQSASASALSLLYRYAGGRKKIIFYSGARKELDEFAPEVSLTVKDWLVDNVK